MMFQNLNKKFDSLFLITSDTYRVDLPIKLKLKSIVQFNGMSSFAPIKYENLHLLMQIQNDTVHTNDRVVCFYEIIKTQIKDEIIKDVLR